MTPEARIGDGLLVHLDIKLPDGSVADSTRAHGKPTLFRLGEAEISPEFDQQLLGLRVGDHKDFELPPEQAFGIHRPELIQFMERHQFGADLQLEPGLILLFEGINGQQQPGLVAELNGQSVKIDFNLPLAGHRLCFAVDILAIHPGAV